MKQLLSLTAIFGLSLFSIGCGGEVDKAGSENAPAGSGAAETPELGEGSSDPGALTKDAASSGKTDKTDDEARKDEGTSGGGSEKETGATDKDDKKKPAETETIEDDKDEEDQ